MQSSTQISSGAVDHCAVQLSGVAKRYGTGPSVFDNLNLQVNAGEAVAIIGANGSGKSTLLRSLNALNTVDAGSITVLGQSVRTLSPQQLRKLRARIGFVFQRHFLVSRLSALSNVIHGMQSRNASPRMWTQWLAPAGVRREAIACLARVGLDDRALQRVDSLSGGQSQRVAIARMLMQQPELIIADEPDASLDPKAGAEVMELLFNLSREAGRTLVFVSHDMEHAVRFSDRIIGLSGGRVMLDVPSATAQLTDLNAFFAPVEDHQLVRKASPTRAAAA